MATVRVEGKTVQLDDKIVAKGKDAIRDVLSLDFPGVENAQIEVVEEPGRPAVVTVSKRAQPKGQGTSPPLSAEQRRVVAILEAAPAYLNPAVALAAEVMRAESAGDAEFFESAVRRGEVERAVSESNREGQAAADTLLRLGKAQPAPSLVVAVGF